MRGQRGYEPVVERRFRRGLVVGRLSGDFAFKRTQAALNVREPGFQVGNAVLHDESPDDVQLRFAARRLGFLQVPSQ